MHESEDIDEHPGVTKIKRMWDRGEFETIDRMVQFWEALENLGRLGDMVKRFIIWSGIIAGSYFVIYEYLIEWVKKAARQ